MIKRTIIILLFFTSISSLYGRSFGSWVRTEEEKVKAEITGEYEELKDAAENLITRLFEPHNQEVEKAKAAATTVHATTKDLAESAGKFDELKEKADKAGHLKDKAIKKEFDKTESTLKSALDKMTDHAQKIKDQAAKICDKKETMETKVSDQHDQVQAEVAKITK